MPLPIPCDCTPAGHRCPRLYPPHLRPFPGAGVRRDSGAWPAAPSPRRSSAGTVSVQSDYHFRGLAKLLTAPAQCATAICCTGPKVKPRWNPQIRCGRLKRQHTGNGRSLGTAVPRPRWPFCGSCAQHTAPLVVFWDNAPAHGGDPLRDYLRTPKLQLRLVRLPAYSPDFKADEHIWAWVRAEVTANTCFGTAEKVRAHVDPFFAGLADRTTEVKQRCRTELQSRADALDAAQVDLTVASLWLYRQCPIDNTSAYALVSSYKYEE